MGSGGRGLDGDARSNRTAGSLLRVEYHNAWSWILEALDVPAYIHLLDKVPDPIYPKHTIAYESFGSVSGVRRLRADGLVCRLPDHHSSQEFHTVRHQLIQRWGKTQRSLDERIRVCLDLDLELLDDDVTQAFDDLVVLSALTQDLSQRTLLHDVDRVQLDAPTDHQESQLSDVFQLQWVEVTTGVVVVTDHMLTSLAAIDRAGVHVSLLTIDRGLRVSDSLSLPTIMSFLQSIVLTPASLPMALSVDGDMHASFFQAICSALAGTQRVNDIRLATPNVVGVDYWAWIAYALLSGDNLNSIECLRLGVEHLTPTDIRHVERVLCARDPLAALAPTSSFNDRDRAVVDVRPGTDGRVRVDNAETEFLIDSIDDRHASNLRLVDDTTSSTHIGILYPGAGLCWVRRDDVVARRSLPPIDSVTTFASIEFELGNQTSLPALLSFIQLIGARIQHLLLFAVNIVYLTSDFMRDVLAACPHLKRLDLTYITVSDFSWLTGNQTSRLELLRLKHVESNAPEGYAPIFSALKDSDHGLGSTLRELAIGDYFVDIETLCPNMTSMLVTNHCLERFLIRIRIDDNTEEQKDAFKTLVQRLEVHDGDPLVVVDKPLSLDCRQAFLSVFTHRKDLPELEPSTLGILFAFAASNKRRVCRLMRV